MSLGSPTRDIARAAVRAELAQVAFRVFCQEGYDQVTVNDVAAAAGVSRSTFLRYFITKEDAILHTMNAEGVLIAETLRSRPLSEDDWTALRSAMKILAEHFLADPDRIIARSRLILRTPSLHAESRERQAGWRLTLTEVLVERYGAQRPPAVEVVAAVRAAAAIDCVNIAVEHWATFDKSVELVPVLYDAFAALNPRDHQTYCTCGSVGGQVSR